MTKTPTQFFGLAYERECVRLRRLRGDPYPWTEDPIFPQWRFCNVNREDDKVTVWFRENLRDPLKDDPLAVLWATFIFRRFNRIATGELIKPILLAQPSNYGAVIECLRDAPPPLFTDAYMVHGYEGEDKLTTSERIFDAAKGLFPTLVNEPRSLSHWHSAIMSLPEMGSFTAYQPICDLRYTSCLETAPDIDTWTAIGPGSKRGLEWIYGHADNPVTQMRDLLEVSRDPEHWPDSWFRWELSTVQHWLCEADKYWRAEGGARQKRRYPCPS